MRTVGERFEDDDLKHMYDAGEAEQVRIAAANVTGAVALPKGDPLLVNATAYLSESRNVERIAVHDAHNGFYKRLHPNEII